MKVEQFKKLLTEHLSVDVQVDLLKSLTLEGLTAAELTGCAQAVLAQAHTLPLVDPLAVDLVGTGGDGAKTFNVSTTAALVAAAAGVKMAKHGNKAITSRSGSFDLLRALDVQVPETAEQATTQFSVCGATFLFAPFFHPVLKKVSDARVVLSKQGVRTIFNVLGPLLNPMRVKRQALGVFAPRLIKPYIETVKAMGSEKALVFHGEGLDELSLLGVNKLAILDKGKITYTEFSAESLGLTRCTMADLLGGSPEENAKITLAILSGEDRSVRRDMVCLNAAAAIIVSHDDVLCFKTAIDLANQAIDQGKVQPLLEKLRGQDVDTH